jgi:hypothetical protein
MDSFEDCPEGVIIAEVYHESKAEAQPPEPVSAMELVALLRARFATKLWWRRHSIIVILSLVQRHARMS